MDKLQKVIKKIDEEIKDSQSYWLSDYKSVYNEQVNTGSEKPKTKQDKIDFLMDLEIGGGVDDYCALAHSQGYINGLIAAKVFLRHKAEGLT